MPTPKKAQKASTSFSATKGKLPTLAVIPMPADTINDNFISAGWILSQMDMAGGLHSYHYIGGRLVTVGVEAMSFHKPVYVGDHVNIFTDVVRQGRTSLTIRVESWATRRATGIKEKVTGGEFTFVAIDAAHKPVPITRPPPPGFVNQPSPPRPVSSPGPVVLPDPPDLPGHNLSVRTIPLPRDTNYLGDIFGGWILSQMDMACISEAVKLTGQRMATVGVKAMTFVKPVHVGDEVSLYTKVVHTGTTSVGVNVQSWAYRRDTKQYEKVTEGTFSYVAIDNNHRKTPILRPAP